MPFEIRPANEQLPDPEAEPIRPKVARAERPADPYQDVLPPPPANQGRPLAQRMRQMDIENDQLFYGSEAGRRSQRNSGLYPGDEYGSSYGIWDSLLFGNRHCYGWSSEYRMIRFGVGIVFSIVYLLIRGCS